MISVDHKNRLILENYCQSSYIKIILKESNYYIVKCFREDIEVLQSILTHYEEIDDPYYYIP